MLIALLAASLNGCGSGDPSTGELQQSRSADRSADHISQEAAAAQFKGGRVGLENMTIISQPELLTEIVGHRVRSRGPTPVVNTTEYGEDGTATTFLDNVVHRDRYIVSGNALCTNSRGSWHCRRFYRNRDGDIFMLFAADRNELIPVTVEDI